MQLRDFLKRHLHLLVFVLISLLYVFELSRIGTRYKRTENVIHEDAFGYYVLLPALFQYGDPEFTFLDTVLRQKPAFSAYIPPVINTLDNGRRVCKYYSGVALLQAPFYLLARAIDTDRNPDGFGPLYQKAVLVSSAFYLLLGMFLLSRTLRKMGISPAAAALMLPLPLFGTNLLIYASYDIAYSHVYSFFALTGFTGALLDYKRSPGFKQALLCGSFFGLITLIRPFNGIAILFVPLILGRGLLKNKLKFFIKHATGFSIAGLAVLCVQLALWKWQTGSWYVYPYGNESLNILKPALFEFVFGYNCGWALYTPLPFAMLLISIAALAFGGKLLKAAGTALTALSILYLLSCWYYLHYGCTAGCRPITEFYGPLLILFTVSVKPWLNRKWLLITFVPVLGILFWYNRIVQYQFLENIINWCEMNRRRFELVFLKTHDAYKYATSDFWDFSRHKHIETFGNLHPDKTLSIGPNRHMDTMDLNLPELLCGDSAVLVSVQIEADKGKDPGEAYLRLLLNDNGNYRDLHNFLIVKLIKSSQWQHSREYDFHIDRNLLRGQLHIALCTAGGQPDYQVNIKQISFRHIRL